MKKYISLILAIMMIFALCACGGGNGNEDTPEEDISTDGQANMTNPVKEVTGEEFKAAVGVELEAPTEAENVKTFTVDGKLGEMRFTYKGVEYCYRVEKTDGIEDISGVYLSEYASSASLTPAYSSSATLAPPQQSSAASPASLSQENDDESVKITFDEEAGAGFVSWYADGYSYSLSVSKGATFDLLYDMYKLLAA